MFKEVLVITNGQEGHWAGRLAEQQANDFLRGLALRSPDGWTIALRIEVVLETEEPVSIWAVEDADKVHLLREICLRELLRVASDTKSLAPQRLEAHRVAELLNGSALDPPRFDPTAREFFDKFGHLLRPPSKSSSQSDQGRKR